jgi:transposase-like protein
MVHNIPKDRNASFEPKLISKGEKMSEKIESAIIRMYSPSMTTSYIAEQVIDIYGNSVSESIVPNITNRILDSINAWQARPVYPVYFCVWMDAIRIIIKKDYKYLNMCIYPSSLCYSHTYKAFNSSPRYRQPLGRYYFLC